MPQHVFEFMGRTVSPIIHHKVGSRYSRHPQLATSMWLHPPDSIITLQKYPNEPIRLFQPRIFLWLPHFFVKAMLCPHCGEPLEKNGALPPRRMVDVQDVFYIVSWAYYCRSRCKRYFAGWKHELIESLPASLQYEFPGTISHKSGHSDSVGTILRVANQHKMGPTGVQALLFEAHTLKYSKIYLQYLEMIKDRVDHLESDNLSTASSDGQSSIEAFATVPSFPAFGDFTDPNGYGGFVPSVRWLAMMMNKAIERSEADADQHTACIPPTTIAIDDSHKVSRFDVTSFLWLSDIWLGQQAYGYRRWGSSLQCTVDVNVNLVYSLSSANHDQVS